MTAFDDALKFARRPIELNAQPGDHVLVVTDGGTPPDVVEILLAAAESLGFESSSILYPVPVAHGSEPPATVAHAMAAADVALLATSKGINHTSATVKAAASGTRCVFMDEISVEMFCTGAATADYDEMSRLAHALAVKWNEGSTVRVTSELGTDLEAGIAGRRAWEMAGRAFAESWFGLSGCCAFPDGECGVAPVEGTANGTVVFDMNVQTIGPLDEPVTLTIRDSYITDIEGGPSAALVRAQLAGADKNASYCPAEIAIGINEAAVETGLLREDKKILGTCHIAYGANDDIGGTVKAGLHVDGLIRRPTITIDGEVIVENGVVLISADDDADSPETLASRRLTDQGTPGGL